MNLPLGVGKLGFTVETSDGAVIILSVIRLHNSGSFRVGIGAVFRLRETEKFPPGFGNVAGLGLGIAGIVLVLAPILGGVMVVDRISFVRPRFSRSRSSLRSFLRCTHWFSSDHQS